MIAAVFASERVLMQMSDGVTDVIKRPGEVELKMLPSLTDDKAEFGPERCICIFFTFFFLPI